MPHRIKNLALDILYPPTCVACGDDGEWVCDRCVHRIFLFRHGMCARCGNTTSSTHTCAGTWPFRSVTVVGSYADPVLRRLLKVFKYQSAYCLRDSLHILLRRFREVFLDVWPWANKSRMILTEVPTDPRHVRFRGIDHISFLGEIVRETLAPWMEHKTLLRRVRRAHANARLPVDARRARNVLGAFAITQNVDLPTLLIDDILTTGATTSEAARILLSSGAPEVHLLAFAHGR